MSEGRRDPLAVTILVAAIGLATLWWWEGRQGDALREANALAQDYSRDHLGPACDAYAAGKGGGTLVIECGDEPVSDIRNALDPEGASAFKEWLLIGSGDERLRCLVSPQPQCEPVQTAY